MATAMLDSPPPPAAPAATAPAPAAPSDGAPAGAPASGDERLSDIDCTLAYDVAGPTDLLFQIHALDGMDQQVLSESLEISPPLASRVFSDPLVGSRYLRLHAEAGPLQLRYLARVRRLPQPADTSAREVPIAELPDEALQFLNPSRYCESDHLGRVAQKMFGASAPGHARVQQIADWIHDNVDYAVGSTQSTTTARDVFERRTGVCRDFAHLGITFCRALNIPARLVVGYAPFAEPPPDFHAVFEAFIGDRWTLFDATRMSPLENFVRIATGLDAKDVAFATLYGPVAMTAMSPLIGPARD